MSDSCSYIISVNLHILLLCLSSQLGGPTSSPEVNAPLASIFCQLLCAIYFRLRVTNVYCHVFMDLCYVFFFRRTHCDV